MRRLEKEDGTVDPAAAENGERKLIFEEVHNRTRAKELAAHQRKTLDCSRTWFLEAKEQRRSWEYWNPAGHLPRRGVELEAEGSLQRQGAALNEEKFTLQINMINLIYFSTPTHSTYQSETFISG